MSDLVTAARRYSGVRFRHRGRKATGLDCAGLLWRAYKDCGVDLEDFLLYGPEPHEDGLVKRVQGLLGDPVAVEPVRAGQLQAGDIVVMRYDYEPHHLAMVTDYPLGGHAIIHADGWEGRVLEQRLAPDMLARVTHLFRRPI